MIASFNRFIGRFTMYRLTLYSLSVMTLSAAALGYTHRLYYSGTAILMSAVVLTLTAYAVNHLFAFLFRATTNAESSLITGLILSFALAPITSASSLLVSMLAASVAMASKYVIARHGRHIINPAAASLLILDILGGTSATWWVATPVLLPITIVAGFLIVYRLKLVRMSVLFGVVAVLMIIAVSSLQQPLNLVSDLKIALVSYPILYFGLFMLVEPSTLPPFKTDRYIMASLVALLFGAQQHLGFISTTPELALVIGNLYAYMVSYKARVRLTLIGRTKLAPDIYELRFKPNRPLRFTAGQYLEWTLKLPHPDSRGNRRTFTVASSTDETTVRLGVKIGPGRRSRFKQYLETMDTGDTMSVANPAGEFTLPSDSHRKLVWLAGGIGITPFRAMAASLVHTGHKRDIVLIHQGSTPASFAYRAFFESEAMGRGIRPHYLVTKSDVKLADQGLSGPLDPDKLKTLVPDYLTRAFYLSGPTGLIQDQTRMLKAAGVRKKNIITDDFTGF
jgi:ferredoxin-NADP reductase/Na+-translocating ferredoxin:NAD+ oxidoreductase RnfD subunit